VSDTRVITSTSRPAHVVPSVTFSSSRPVSAVCPPTVCTPAVAPTAAPDLAALLALLGGLGKGAIPGLAGKGKGFTPGLAGKDAGLGTLGKGVVPGLAGKPLAQAAKTPSAPSKIFNNPIAQLGGISPLGALAASNPAALLSALSPTLNKFNPAINPQAALLQWNPGAAPTLALTGKGAKPFGKTSAANPLGKGIGKGAFGKPGVI